MSFPVRCLTVLMLISPCCGVEYFLDPAYGQSCDTVCKQQQKICAGTGHGFSPDSIYPLYLNMGITCGPSNKTATYTTPASPNYKYLEFETYDQCNGYQEIPDQINCSARGDENTKRLCPCVHGSFLQFQFIETLLGSTNVVNFKIDGQLYVAFSRLRAFRRYQSGTQIYRLEDNNFIFYQTLKSTYNGPGRATHFQINGENYIAVPYFARKTSSKRAPKTVVFSQYRGYFDAYQELDGGTALSTSFIEVKSYKLLIIQGFQAITIYRWNGRRFTKHQVFPIKRAYITSCTSFKPTSGEFYLACAVWGGNKKSIVLKWTGKRFFVHQRILGVEYAMTAETVELDSGEQALILAKRQKGFRANMNVISPVFTWNNELSLFELNKTLSIRTRGASSCRPFKINNELYIAVSQSAAKKSVIYKYTSGKFSIYQELRALFADDATFFTHQRTHYLVLATQGINYSPAFIWN